MFLLCLLLAVYVSSVAMSAQLPDVESRDLFLPLSEERTVESLQHAEAWIAENRLPVKRYEVVDINLEALIGGVDPKSIPSKPNVLVLSHLVRVSAFEYEPVWLRNKTVYGAGDFILWFGDLIDASGRHVGGVNILILSDGTVNGVIRNYEHGIVGIRSVERGCEHIVFEENAGIIPYDDVDRRSEEEREAGMEAERKRFDRLYKEHPDWRERSRKQIEEMKAYDEALKARIAAEGYKISPCNERIKIFSGWVR